MVVSGIAAFVAWWWVRRRADQSKVQPEASINLVDAVAQVASEPAIPAGAPDDLRVIEGIGPKVGALLRDAGLVTFGLLAETDPDQLRDILRRADLAMMDPSTWPDQARLAADGDWDGLKRLQGELKGGRRT